MISKLSIDDKKLLILRYGNDLSNPIITDITVKEKNRFYNYLVPKMREILENKEVKNEELEIEEAKQLSEKLPSNVNPKNNLSIKEATILSLKFDYHYEIKDIAIFLNISENEVREILKKVLLQYKEYFNYLVDDIINNIELDNMALIKKV